MAASFSQLLKKQIDLTPVGVERATDDTTYFCTPKGASIIGQAGVDGIHYCFIRDFGEMVFAVSPMNGAPDYVYPLAENFTDFLCLLLACGDAGVLEQPWEYIKSLQSSFDYSKIKYTEDYYNTDMNPAAKPTARNDAVCVGVIGGANGPTAIVFGESTQGKLCAACSALHFEPVRHDISWRLIFHEKRYENLRVTLI